MTAELSAAERLSLDALAARVEKIMRGMTPAKRMQFVERLADLAGVTLISEATAEAIDTAYAKMRGGLPVDEDELAAIRYAVAAASPAPAQGDLWRPDA
jgi:hypothetical protein